MARLNELMNQGIQEGIAETEKARRGFVRPVYFTPKNKTPRPQPTEAELDAEFAIPPEVLQRTSPPKSTPPDSSD